MVHYDAAKNKKRICSIGRIHCGMLGLVMTIILITLVAVLLGILLFFFIYEPRMDFRFGDVCSHMRLTEHPVSSPKEGSRLFVIVQIETMEQMGNAFDQIMILIDRLGKAELHVSLSINKMLDLAPPWVEMFQSLLKSKRIPFVYFLEGEKSHLQPLWDRSYDATHVIAIRNSFFCAEDILRIYSQVASVSRLVCGVQFAHMNKRQLRLDVTDFTLHALGVFRDRDGNQQESPALKSILKGFTTPLDCCWSNVAGLAGNLLSSKPEHDGDCLGYDCMKICEMAKGAKLMPSVPVVPDLGTRSLFVVAPLYPEIHPNEVPEL